MKKRVESIAEFLGSLPHFASLSAAELDLLAAAVRVEQHTDAHVFIREGERGDEVYVLMRGEVEVVRVREGREDVVNVILPRELFGLVALSDQGSRSATCRGRGETKVAALSHRALAKLSNGSPAIAFAFQRALATQLARDFRALDRQIRAQLGLGT